MAREDKYITLRLKVPSWEPTWWGKLLWRLATTARMISLKIDIQQKRVSCFKKIYRRGYWDGLMSYRPKTAEVLWRLIETDLVSMQEVEQWYAQGYRDGDHAHGGSMRHNLPSHELPIDYRL